MSYSSRVNSKGTQKIYNQKWKLKMGLVNLKIPRVFPSRESFIPFIFYSSQLDLGLRKRTSIRFLGQRFDLLAVEWLSLSYGFRFGKM